MDKKQHKHKPKKRPLPYLLLRRSTLFILVVLSACRTFPSVKSAPVNHRIEPTYLSILFRDTLFWEINHPVKQMTQYSSVFDISTAEWSSPASQLTVTFTENGLVEKEENHSSLNNTIFRIFFDGNYPIQCRVTKEDRILDQTSFYYNKQGELILKTPDDADLSSRTVRYKYFRGYVIARRQNISIIYKLDPCGRIIESFILKTMVQSVDSIKLFSPDIRILYHYNAYNKLERIEKVSADIIIKSVARKYNEMGNLSSIITRSGKKESAEKTRQIFSGYKYDEYGNWIERTILSQVKQQTWETNSETKEKRRYAYFMTSGTMP